MALSEVLLACVADATRSKLAAETELEATLAGLVDVGRLAWPRVSLSSEAFVRHIGARLADVSDPVSALSDLHAADLYLACASAAQQDAALRELDQHFIARLWTPARADESRVTNEEMRQLVRARLLVAPAGQVPRIGGYSGRGPLLHWLRVAVARIMVDLRRAGKPDEPLQDREREKLRSAAPDPEMNYLKTQYRKEFEEAFQATVAALDARDANVLRMFFQEGVTLTAIGALFKVTPRTVQRWIATARQNILDETHRRLAERLRVPESEVVSIYRFVESQVVVSLSRRWGPGQGRPPGASG